MDLRAQVPLPGQVLVMFPFNLVTLLVGVKLFVELVFAYPGVGYLTYNALLTRDYPLLQGIFLVVTVAVLLANLAVDALYPKLDPRLSHAH